jgi:hypothetical protein
MTTAAVYDESQHGPLLAPKEAAARLWDRFRLNRSHHRLAELRYSGRGPGFIKVGNEVRYPTALLDEWARAQVTRPILTVIGAVIERPEAA